MSIIFSDNFNSGSPTGWGTPHNVATVNLWGFGGTYCVGCFSGQIRKTLASAIPSAGSIRVQLAAIITTNPDDTTTVLIVQDFHAGSAESKFQMLVYVNQDGSLSVRLSDVYLGAPTFKRSAVGVFPVDGVQRGLQVTFTLIAGTLSANFFVNNISVWTFTHTPTTPWVRNSWDDFWIQSWRQPIGGPPLTDITTHDNYEADDSNASVSWPNGSASALDLNRVCFLAPAPPTDGTITIIKRSIPTGSSTSFHVVATGTGLSDFDIIDGQSVPFTVAPGSGYSIVEDAESGFVTTYLISNGSPHTNITVANGENVVVTITNQSSLGGIYFINPLRTSDKLYIDAAGNTTDFPIPNPFGITALIGDE